MSKLTRVVQAVTRPIRVVQTNRQASVPTVPFEPEHLAVDGTYVAIDPEKDGSEYTVCHGRSLEDVLASPRFDGGRHLIYCRFNGKWERLFWAYRVDEHGASHDQYRRISK